MNTMKEKGLTMIEMVVTVSILALLVGLMIPGLDKASLAAGNRQQLQEFDELKEATDLCLRVKARTDSHGLVNPSFIRFSIKGNPTSLVAYEVFNAMPGECYLGKWFDDQVVKAPSGTAYEFKDVWGNPLQFQIDEASGAGEPNWTVKIVSEGPSKQNADDDIESFYSALPIVNQIQAEKVQLIESMIKIYSEKYPELALSDPQQLLSPDQWQFYDDGSSTGLAWDDLTSPSVRLLNTSPFFGGDLEALVELNFKTDSGGNVQFMRLDVTYSELPDGSLVYPPDGMDPVK